MKNQVATYRAAGLEAKWSKTSNGAPFIFVRNPTSKLRHQREQWWIVDRSMFEKMQHEGIVDGFTNQTLLGDIFSIPA